MSEERYERSFSASVDGDKIDITIIEFAHAYSIEVTHTPARGSVLVLHTTAHSIEAIEETLKSERLYPHFAAQLAAVMESMQLRKVVRDDRRQIESVNDMTGKIPFCDSDFTLTALLKEVFLRLDITSFLFITLLADSADKDRSSYNFQQGCDGLFFSQYRDRAWHDMDPFIGYAKIQQRPVFISGFPKKSVAERDFHEHCRKHGFASGMVIPAKSDSGNRIGMLLVGVDKDPSVGEEMLGKHRTLLRGMAMDVLEWWIEDLKPKGVDVSQLKQIDKDILKLLHKKKSEAGAKEIAMMLDINPDKVYNRYREIKRIFGTKNMAESAQLALEYGVIGSY